MTRESWVSHSDLKEAIHSAREHVQRDLKEAIHDLKAELHHLRENAREIRDHVDHVRKHTHEIKEKLMTLQGSVDTLGAVVAKLVTDFAGTQTMIQGLRDKVDDLVAQGTASAAELADLKGQIDTATPKIDAVNAQLQALDDSIKDPTTPLDPNTPV